MSAANAKTSAAGTKTHEARAYTYESPRPEIQPHVPDDAKRVLDLGCASGALGEALKRRSPTLEVVGVEIDPLYAERARARLDRVIEADLESLVDDLERMASLGSFDCLVAGDVLEHLREPWTVLERFVELVRPGGAVVVSVPNVRYWQTFWHLLRGTWPRWDDGIFDRDHLRWFTVRDAIDLLETEGLEVVEIDRQLRLRPNGPNLDRLAPIVIRTPLRPFFTFQVVLAARRPA